VLVEIIAAYNLLVYIIRQAPKPEMFLSRICQYLSKPISTSPQNGTGLALAILSTVFNTVPADSEARFHIFRAVLSVVKSSNNFETLEPQLKNLDAWIAQWDIDGDEQRQLYLEISEAAESSGETDASYNYLLKALHTFSADEASSQEAQKLSLQALKAALIHPTHFDFEDLASLDAIQALKNTDTVAFELLEIFTSDDLSSFSDFKTEHDGYLSSNGLDKDVLDRKMRLLTLASLAAHENQKRTLSYTQIAKALQVPEDEVEMWVIDVIRAGLVEGKLSQLNQQFLIHRSTYRVFGEKQWQEVSVRLDMWRSSLTEVLGVIRQEKENYIQQKEQELRDTEAKVNGLDGQKDGGGRGEGRGGFRGGRGRGGGSAGISRDAPAPPPAATEIESEA
jgi:translation initiation factor 3 subunit M